MSEELQGWPTPSLDAGVMAGVSTVSASCARLCGADGASVALLAAGRLSPLYATDTTSAAVEESQVVVGEGPCIDAVTSGAPVLVADVRDPRETGSSWPVFLRETTSMDLRAIFAFPIRIGAIRLGTLEMYRRAPGIMTAPQLGAALRSVDVLGGVLLGLAEVEGPQVSRYRGVVHQAAGMITVQLDITIEEAMVRLRAAAYAAGRSINELADDVVQRLVRFSEEEKS